MTSHLFSARQRRWIIPTLLLGGMAGCHHRHQCPCHHQGPGGVTNADYYESRGQSQDEETTLVRTGIEGEADGVARLHRNAVAMQRATPEGHFRDARFVPVRFSPAEPRQILSESGEPLSEPGVNWMTGTDVQRYPDEYLFDGGDRDHPVHYDAYNRYGLDTEDTVGECVDHQGQRWTVPSNSVAIYAPRFAAVRSITRPGGQVAIEHIAGTTDLTRDSGVSSNVNPQGLGRNLALQDVQTRLRASGLESRNLPGSLGNVARLHVHNTPIKGREDLAYIFRGEFHRSNEAYLANGISAAFRWTKNEGTLILATDKNLQEVRVIARPAETVGLEDRHADAGELRILKVADKSVAQPGDIVTFVIRFDNLGGRELHDVRIIDNLTPRLEYIEDSATCDLPGDIIVEDNQEGSLVLTFALDDPLPGRAVKEHKDNKGKEIKTGGVITFQCRVR